MIRNLLSLLLLFVATFVSAQVVIFDANNQDISGVASDGASFESPADVTNTTPSTVNFWWTLDRSDNMPREWQFQICDLVRCYNYGTETVVDGEANELKPSETLSEVWSVKLNPNGVAGAGTITIRTFSTIDTSTQYGDFVVNYNLDPSSVFETEFDNIQVYPNPATDFFQIKNDASVDRVTIYNVLGKEISSYDHSPSKTYSVKDFETGLYLIRLFDEDGGAMKDVRLNKE